MKLFANWTKLFTITSVFVLLLAGCSSGASTSSSNETNGKNEGKAPIGGELTYALATSPDTLDPHRSGLAVAVRAFRTIFDSLVVLAPAIRFNHGSQQNGLYRMMEKAIPLSCVRM